MSDILEKRGLTKDDVKDHLVSVIREYQGIKVVELVTKVQREYLHAFNRLGLDMFDLCDELIKEKKIIGFEYTIPELGNRYKMFVVPFHYIDIGMKGGKMDG